MTETTYAADPGQNLASDVHRRVLGHLSTPDDKYGWKVPSLYHRLKADVHESFGEDQLAEVLNELKESGHAKEHDGGAWQQTKEGFEALTAQPPAAEGPRRPAEIGAATPLGEPLREAPKPDLPEGATSVEG